MRKINVKLPKKTYKVKNSNKNKKNDMNLKLKVDNIQYDFSGIIRACVEELFNKAGFSSINYLREEILAKEEKLKDAIKSLCDIYDDRISILETKCFERKKRKSKK